MPTQGYVFALFPVHLNSGGSDLLMKCNRFYESDQKCLSHHGQIAMEHDRRKTPNLPHKYGPYLHPKIEKHVENLPTVTTPSLKRVYFVSWEFFLSVLYW